MKAFHKATAFFREMQLNDAYDSRWGEFADAMDEAFVLIDEMQQIVRCKECVYYNSLMGYCKDGRSYPSPNWFCADGERKEE